MAMLLNIKPIEATFHGMKKLCSITLATLLAAQTASAACYADYKAKQDDPLRLSYGVIELTGPCTAEAAASEIQTKISNDGWTVLTVVSVFDENGLEQRKESAGEFFLRY